MIHRFIVHPLGAFLRTRLVPGLLICVNIALVIRMFAIAAWRNPQVYQMTMTCALVGKRVIVITWKLAPGCSIMEQHSK